MNHGPAATDATDSDRAEALRITALGYRRTSNKYRMVSRIDDPDWIVKLAKHLGRSPAELYVPGASSPSPTWCDHWRRVYSKDKIELQSQTVFRLIPSSDWDECGYVEPPSKQES